jgi:16S rRNA pseudouridine516 synthase
VALIKYLANLGYGTRREVTALVAARRASRADGTTVRDDEEFTHTDLRVDGQPLDPPPGSLLLLNKPTGYVCSSRDVPPLVYDLLPERFRRRTPILAPVGRLDRETSGLLLLTDDGALNHRLTSPRSHLSRTYEATLTADISAEASQLFASGTLLLSGERTPLSPATLHRIDARTIEITITEGRYHQVRRMLAAVGNHVVTLKRVAHGVLTLGDLPEGLWRELTASERALLDR